MQANELKELFITVCDDARNGHTGYETRDTGVRALFKIDKALECFETNFLVAPLIENALRKIIDNYYVSMKSILDGSYTKLVERYTTLVKEIERSDAKHEWNESYKKISEVITQMGMTSDEEFLSDMASVANVLLDAFTTVRNGKHIKLQAGKGSSQKPVFVRDMPQFATIGEVFKHFKSIVYDSCIMFAAVCPTFSQAEDGLYEWARGYQPEMITNRQRNEKDFDPNTDLAHFKSKIVIAIKRGENIWFRIQSNTDVVHASSFNVYNGVERSVFLPLQIFFKEKPSEGESDCTALAVPGKNWGLDKIADPEQALWLPTLFWLLEREYFTNEIDEDEPVVILGEHIQPQLVDGQGKVVGQSVNRHLPAIIKNRVLPVDVMTVPDGIKTHSGCELVLQKLGITADDITGAPVMTAIEFSADERDFKYELWYRYRTALAVAAERKIKELYKHSGWRDRDMTEAEREVFLWYKNLVSLNKDRILEQASACGTHINKMSSFRVHGELSSNENDYLGRPITEVLHASDSRYKGWGEILFLMPETLAEKRPYAVLKITPETAEDISLLTGTAVKDLPWELQVWGVFKKHSQIDLRFSRNSYDGLKDPMLDIKRPYPFDPDIRYAFSKTEYKPVLKRLNETE
jgi:hypothetical protein